MAYDPKKEYDYADVPELVGYLKRSAIDAYMMSENSGITSHCTIMDDRYVVSFPIPLVGSSDRDIARPGMDGQGGGDILSSDDGESDGDYAVQFDAVRLSIDEILKPWMTLPDSKSIGSQIEKWITVVSELAKEPLVFDPMNGRSTGSGTIFSNLRFAGTSITHMSGAVIDKVKMFLANLEQVVGGLHAQIMFWGGTLYTEMRIFDRARSSLVDALKQGIKVFDAVASNGGAGIKMALEIVSTAIDVFLTFTNPSVVFERRYADANAKALKGFSSLAEPKVDGREAEDFRAGLDVFEKALDRVSEGIDVAERGIEKALFEALASMSETDHRKYYDLKAVAIDSNAIAPTPQLNVDYGKAKGICGDLGRIQESVRAARKSTPLVSMSACVYRGEGVGYCYTGPSRGFDQMRLRIELLLESLVNDIENEIKNFELAVEAIIGQDAEAQTQLNEIVEHIKNSSDNPWREPKAVRVAKGRNQIV